MDRMDGNMRWIFYLSFFPSFCLFLLIYFPNEGQELKRFEEAKDKMAFV